jgi:alkanesulfonate monooxygenase SsuD/methylene tetrahydromethanopterin reductase-like flavin-dependent oxidoreductase (luciferase family)
VTYPFRLGLLAAVPRSPLEESIELARAAEEAGFAAIGVGDAVADTLVVLGALARETSRIELHATIANWSRTPVTTALAATTLAELTRGRFRLGLGAMPRRWSEDWHGIDYAAPVARMRDYVTAIRDALRAQPGQPVDHEGRFYRFRAYERLDASPPYAVPITLGVIRPRMSELAGEIADGVIIDSPHSTGWIRDRLWPRFEAGLAASGRPRESFDVGVGVICAVDDDPARARDLARRTIAFYLMTPYLRDVLEHHGFGAECDEGVRALELGDRGAAARAITDEIVETIAVAGPPEEFRAQLRRYDGLVDWVRLNPPHAAAGEVTREQTLRIIETVGRVASTGQPTGGGR